MFPDGDVLVGIRHFNALMRIDKATGDVKWKLGGTTRGDGKSLTITTTRRPGRTRTTGGCCPTGRSRCTTTTCLGPARPAPSRRIPIDTAAKTATLTWSYAAR